MVDVAILARVSIQTVSNVVNRRTGRYSDRTRLRVEKAIEELGYVRSWTARGLRSDRSGQLAYLVADPTPRFFERSYHQEVIAGLAEAARRRGYAIVLQGTFRKAHSLRELAAPLLDGRADGAVVSISGGPTRRRAHLAELALTGRPIIALDEPAPPDGIASVIGGDESAVRQAVDHLVASGHRRLALILGPTRWADVDAKLRGFSEATRRHGIRAQDRLIERVVLGAPEEPLPDAVERAVSGLLQAPNAPTGLVGASDQACAGILRAVRSARLELKVDVAVVGILDEYVASSLLETPLTASQISRFAVGQVAGEMLLDRLDCGYFDPVQREIQARLVVRQSA